MDEMLIQKIYPSPEELSSICSKVKCPQDNCEAIFQSSSNLNMHLIKHHKISGNGLMARKTVSQYFCPTSGCPYHKGSEKHFTRLKYLKQHFLKVHAAKKFPCKKCDKKFSTETFRALHMKSCGETFHCSCGFSFTSSEAILTHCKRKGKDHKLVKKNEEVKSIQIKSSKELTPNGKKSERFIYPKISKDLSFPIHYIAAVALSELSAPCNISRVADKCIQTEARDSESNKEPRLKFEKKKKYSQQTQTLGGRNKKLKISTQTQTTNDYLRSRAKGCSKILCKKKKKSMETQTKDQNKTCESFNLNNLDKSENFVFNKSDDDRKKLNFEMKGAQEIVTSVDEEKPTKWLWDMDMVSSSTNKTSDFDLQYTNRSLKSDRHHYLQEQDNQGSQIFDINKLCNIETQTEIDAFLTECNNEDTAFTLCSTTETQTTDDFDSLLYSNMCTQTCEEVDQLFNFNFVHIETQTAWPDLNDQ